MKEFPQIFAFYSFKGGVGRSMAVLNLAYALAAKGRNVLVLDMDLEAPGLSGFLDRTDEIAGFARFDMVDLVRWASSATLPLDPQSFPPLSDYVVSIPPAKLEPIPRVFSELGRLDIIPVQGERDYYDRLTALSLGSLDQDALVRIGSVLRAWLKSLRFPIVVPDYYGPDCERAAPYDYVFVDSRTGITETGGLCIGPLSDRLVVLSALNDQNVEGTRTFLEEVGVLKSSSLADAETEQKPCLIVASLVPTGDMETKQERLEQLEKSLGKVRVKLSYHPRLALKETIFTRNYRNEYLAREYDEMLDQILAMASDGDDRLLTDAVFNKSRSSVDLRATLRSLTRSASVAMPNLLFFLLSTRINTEAMEEVDYILWDRACRMASIGESPIRWDIVNRWSDLLAQWASHSTGPVLAALRREASMSCYEQFLEADEGDPSTRALALFNRGSKYSERGEPEKEIADYTALIQMADAPADPKAKALFNRGIRYGQRGEPEKEIADYTALIQMADAPADPRAKALLNRGSRYSERGEPEKAIADYTALIEMADAPASPRANALLNRGVTYCLRAEPEKEIADYTALIKMLDAPADQKAKALLNRGVAHGRRGEAEKEIADYTAAIEMADAPADHKAKALVSRGLTYGRRGEPEKAINDYTAVIEMADAPADHRASALLNRGVALRPARRAGEGDRRLHRRHRDGRRTGRPQGQCLAQSRRHSRSARRAGEGDRRLHRPDPDGRRTGRPQGQCPAQSRRHARPARRAGEGDHRLHRRHRDGRRTGRPQGQCPAQSRRHARPARRAGEGDRRLHRPHPDGRRTDRSQGQGLGWSRLVTFCQWPISRGDC